VSAPTRASWDPCVLCDDPNGRSRSRHHITPSRFRIESYIMEMTQDELIKTDGGGGECCAACYERLKQRRHRQRRVEKGLTARDRRRLEDWKP